MEKLNLCCDSMDDHDLFKAVSFSLAMMREGTPAPLANRRAARYYEVKLCDVAKCCCQHAARIKEGRRWMDWARKE